MVFILRFRADPLYLNASKQAVKPALDAFSGACGLLSLSVSTIRRLIADAPDGMLAGPRIDLDRRRRRKPHKPRCNHEDLAADFHVFNRQFVAWFLWCNAQKPHRALAGNTPLNFLHARRKNGQVLWAPMGIKGS